MIEEVLGLLLELFGECALTMLLEPGFAWIPKVAGRAFVATRPFLAAFSLLFLGLLLGRATASFFPERIFHAAIPGFSLVVTPVIAGIVMQLFGVWRKSGGRPTTFLATFWGGFVFAFGFTWARFLLVAGV